MAQNQFEQCLGFVLKWEGSVFTDDPDDHGGATRYGIIQREYDRYRQTIGKPLQSVEAIAMDEVRTIYRSQYWVALQCEATPIPLDLVLLDTGILMGVGRSARLLQEALGIHVDGVIGKDTRSAITGADPATLARDVMDLREQRLRVIVEHDATQQKFLKGWLNRLNDLRATAGITVPEFAMTESGMDESVSNEQGLPASAIGRANDDLPEQQARITGVKDPVGTFSLFEKMRVPDFLVRSRTLLTGKTTGIFGVDTSASTNDELHCFYPGGTGRMTFVIPSIAVETITPLRVHQNNPTRLVAAITFRQEFSVLVRALQQGQITGGAGSHQIESDRFHDLVLSDTRTNDPAAPDEDEINDIHDFETARILSNIGTPGYAAVPEGVAEPARPEIGVHATMALNIEAAKSFLAACENAVPRVTYGLGAKVPFAGAVPGIDYQRIDCSGFVREVIRRATDPMIPFPDGSVVQHDWVRARGFEKTTVEKGTLQDRAVRIAFLRPQDVPSRIGHVALIYDGFTLESHGGVGPDSRKWTGGNWQQKTSVYVLLPPAA